MTLSQVKTRIAPVTLAGQWVQLEPLAEKHMDNLFIASQHEEIWPYMPIAMPRVREDVELWLKDTLAKQARGEALPFAIVERASDRAIGSTRYLEISEQDRHVEIGWTWLGRNYWRTPINTECKYLLLKHAFEHLRCIRVQLKTDLRNARSQGAIERLGAVKEGVLRKAVLVKGYERWSVYYSILDDEWPAVKARLEGFLTAPTGAVSS